MKTIIFIVGAGHSGSTILAKALNAHSQVFALSEISQFYDEMQNEMTHCGCGELLRECAFWDDVNVRLRDKMGYGIKEDPNKFRISRDLNKNKIIDKINFKLSRIMAICFYRSPKLIRNRLEKINILFDTIIEKTGNDYLVDSSKSAKWAYLIGKFLSKNGYDIKIIHLVRDGRGVLFSYLKGYYKVKLKNRVTGEYEMQTFYSENKRNKEDIVQLWKQDNYWSLFYHKILNKNYYHFLRYEDFANGPVKILQYLLPFLDLQYEKEMLDLNRYENHMVSGNASRINAERILKPFDSWKEKLTEPELSYFKKKGGRLNRKFGYQ